MATDSNTLLDVARCLGCASNSSIRDLLKLGILGRIASAYSAVQSFITRAGITDPVQMAAVSTLAEAAVTHGWWGKCDLIYPFVGGNATAHAQNLKSSSFTITWNGTVTHDANGITGNGVDGYGDTSYIPASSGQFALTNAHVGLYRRTFGTINSRYYCACTSGGALVVLQRGTANATFRMAMTDNNITTMTLSSVLAWLVATKLDASLRRSYQGGVENTVVAVNSPGPPTVSLFILSRNNNGIAADFLDANLAGVTVGSGITFSDYQLMASDWQTFQTALGRQV